MCRNIQRLDETSRFIFRSYFPWRAAELRNYTSRIEHKALHCNTFEAGRSQHAHFEHWWRLPAPGTHGGVGGYYLASDVPTTATAPEAALWVLQQRWACTYKEYGSTVTYQTQKHALHYCVSCVLCCVLRCSLFCLPKFPAEIGICC